ncbi:MAG: MFS transporter [Chloroflexi bacterium]|nr:MFS transporter [Chloroflexota bacterium]
MPSFMKSFPLAARVAIGKLSYAWIILLTCFIIGVTAAGLRTSFGVFFKSIETEFDLTRASTSVIFSANVLSALVFSIVGGWALDRYGPRKVLTVMGIFASLSLYLTSQTSSLWQIFISYSVLLAVGTGALFPVLASTVSRWFVSRRGLALGIVSAAFNVGMVVMAPFATYLISSYGWRKTYFILALIVFFIVVPSATLLRRAPYEVAALAEEEKAKSMIPSPTRSPAPSVPQSILLFEAMRGKSFWMLFFMWVLLGTNMYTIAAHMVPHAIDLGIAATNAAFILSLVGGASIFGGTLMGRVSDTIGRKKSMMICSSIMAGAMVWVVWSSTLWALYLFAIVFGFSFGGFTAPLSALAADTFGLHHLGKIAAVLEAGWMLGGTIGPTFAGYVFDATGSYVPAFLAGALAALASVLLVALFRPARQKSPS